MTARRAVIGLAAALSMPPAVTRADELRPAYLQLKQAGEDTFDVLWKVPARGEFRLRLRVRFSDECEEVTERTASLVGDAYLERWRVRCPGGFGGQRVEVEGLSATFTDVLVRVEWSGGPTWTARLDPAEPSFVIEAPGEPGQEPGWSGSAASYTSLGIHHILLGLDHLFFVFGLLLIVRGVGPLVKTITAFTVAHSITLALAVCGVVDVAPQPVDAAIALSIVFLAAEVIHARRGYRGLTVNHTWVISFGFGLLHGLGFAGALTTLGLPSDDIPLALLFFNVGVEVGQLMFVAFLLTLAWAFRTLEVTWPGWSKPAPAYAIGSLAVYWFIDRFLAMLPNFPGSTFS